MQELIYQNKNVLHQLHLATQLLSETDYTSPLPILSGSTIGMHVRHVVEFYECLINGMELNEINYDARQRNHLVETNLVYALQCIASIIASLDNCFLEKQISLAAVVNDADAITLPTSVFRELYYLLEHTTHHMAIIKMAFLTSFESKYLPENFGVANSTIQYKKNVYSHLSSYS
jgi:uncharacterized damage-inducible protein DinB